MIKTEQDYELTDHASAFYSENNTKLSWLIGSSVDSDETR